MVDRHPSQGDGPAPRCRRRTEGVVLCCSGSSPLKMQYCQSYQRVNQIVVCTLVATKSELFQYVTHARGKIRCRFDPALEPMPAEATHLAPPCCVSPHRSHVVDPDGPTTFLHYREARFGIPQMTPLIPRSGHHERFPIESSPPSLSEDSYRGEAPCSLAPCTRGSHVTLPSVSGWSGCAPAMCSF